MDTAVAVTSSVQEKIDSRTIKNYKKNKVVTQIWSATQFYTAE